MKGGRSDPPTPRRDQPVYFFGPGFMGGFLVAMLLSPPFEG